MNLVNKILLEAFYDDEADAQNYYYHSVPSNIIDIVSKNGIVGKKPTTGRLKDEEKFNDEDSSEDAPPNKERIYLSYDPNDVMPGTIFKVSEDAIKDLNVYPDFQWDGIYVTSKRGDKVVIPPKHIKIYKKINEVKLFDKNDTNQKFYHHTDRENAESILKYGLLLGKNNDNGKTLTDKADHIKNLYKGIIPIFLTSNKNMFKGKEDVTLEVNIAGLEKTSDLPTFEDWLYSVFVSWKLNKHGYCFDYDMAPEELWDILDGRNCLTFKQLLVSKKVIDKIIDITQTVAILENISPNRIKLKQWKGAKLIKSYKLDEKGFAKYTEDKLKAYRDKVDKWYKQKDGKINEVMNRGVNLSSFNQIHDHFDGLDTNTYAFITRDTTQFISPEQKLEVAKRIEKYRKNGGKGLPTLEISPDMLLFTQSGKIEAPGTSLFVVKLNMVYYVLSGKKKVVAAIKDRKNKIKCKFLNLDKY